jgi:hypothetical protein
VKPYAQNDSWAQRLDMARDIFAEVRAEQLDSPTDAPTVQGPLTNPSGLFPEETN